MPEVGSPAGAGSGLGGRSPWLIAALGLVVFVFLDRVSNILDGLSQSGRYAGGSRGRLLTMFGAAEAFEAVMLIAVVLLVVLFAGKVGDGDNLSGLALLGATVLGVAGVVGALVSLLIYLSYLGDAFGTNLAHIVDEVGDIAASAGAALWAYREWQARGAPTSA
jgi:hypothetical protein